MDFSPKAPSEVLVFTFDFVNLLAQGETINSATVTSVLISGTDAAPSTMILGSASISGSTVMQKVQGGELGVRYQLRCLVVTNLQTLLLAGDVLVVDPP
jgi:hypothetical protein